MNEIFTRQLQSSGYKLTTPRQVVFTYLQTSGPMRPQDIASRLVGQIDRASAYRTLTLFRDLNIIHELILGGRKVIELTDRFSHHHHHLTCLRCGGMQTVTDDELETVLRRIVATRGFKAQGHLIEVQGICKACSST